MNTPITAPVTGQTPLYSKQMQEWAAQNYMQQDIECYCLDAPVYIPTGGVHVVFEGSRFCTGQAEFKTRPGT